MIRASPFGSCFFRSGKFIATTCSVSTHCPVFRSIIIPSHLSSSEKVTSSPFNFRKTAHNNQLAHASLGLNEKFVIDRPVRKKSGSLTIGSKSLSSFLKSFIILTSFMHYFFKTGEEGMATLVRSCFLFNQNMPEQTYHFKNSLG